MARFDRSRPSRVAIAVLGIVIAVTLGVLLGVVRQAGWLSLIFAMGFALVLLLEMAGGWEESTRPYRRRVLHAFLLLLGMSILGVVTYEKDGSQLYFF
jgi:formate hydrogenlyase subunit 3/multisubunit Na+/H+ antiporter MnhD subunit